LAHCDEKRQQQRGPEEYDDLLQEARLGLIQGMDNWKRSRGFRPSSYLISRANGQFLHYWRDRSRISWLMCRVSVCSRNGCRRVYPS
jgi:RNA polymerase sigma-B factor